MAIRVHSATLNGIEPVPILIEVDFIRRLPKITFVGLAAHSVQEAAERVRSAILAIGKEFPRQRIVINLAPADVKKEGTAFDLPVALGILAADGQIPASALENVISVGELGLGGELRPIRGATTLALHARSKRKTLILPKDSASQAEVVPGAQVLAADHLSEVLDFLVDGSSPPAIPRKPHLTAGFSVDLAEVRGQASGRRALEIAAAGAHHLLLLGPPGCGKSMLSQRLPTILPPLSFEESLEVTQIHGAAGLLSPGVELLHQRPFRAPHHTISIAGLVGDRRLRPGEVSLAHHGVLFLDEACEFPRSVLEVLRTPLEEGVVRLVRAEGSVSWPAAITLVLATNPCPCGRRGGFQACRCSDGEVFRYRRRLSGPIEDRIDLHLELAPPSAENLTSAIPGESSETVRRRVISARGRQLQRGQTRPNGRLTDASLEEVLHSSAGARELMQAAMTELHLSGRGMTRLWRVARTIADLDGSEALEDAHLAEAIGFRLGPM